MCVRSQHFYFVGNREQETHLYGTTAHLSFQSMNVCICVDAGSSPLFSRLRGLVGWFLGWAGSVRGSFQTSKAQGEKRRGGEEDEGGEEITFAVNRRRLFHFSLIVLGCNSFPLENALR